MRDDLALVLEVLVAAERRSRRRASSRAAQVDAELARRARAFALRFHRLLEARLVDREPALARDVGGEVDREAVGVVELEDGLAGDRLALAASLIALVEQRHAVLERLGESLLFLLQHAHDVIARRFASSGIGRAHLGRERRHERVEERLVLAELVAVADRAADDPAQHVAAAVVAGNHAVGDQERAGADVVRDHAQDSGSSGPSWCVASAAAAIRFRNRSMS